MRSRITGIVVGLVLGSVILTVFQSQGPIAKYTLLPENSGSIRSVALQYTLESCRYSNSCYRVFLSKINPEVEIVGICGSREDALAFKSRIHEWKIHRPERVRTVVLNSPITGWCKDRFLVSTSPAGGLIHPSLFEEASPGRIADSSVVPGLVRAFPERFKDVPVPLKFDAGDILAVGSTVIVSDTLWNRNACPPDFRQRLQRAFGSRLIWLRGAPNHHIGMYAAPLDEKIVMVGDPALGRKLWSEKMTANLGQPDFSRAAMAPFKQASTQLKQAGFRVIPLPTAVLDTKVYVSYTNGVFETRGKRRIVYMPWYDEPGLDQCALRAYRSAGWEVVPIPVKTVYRFRGTIGCLVNVLERQYP